MATLNNPKLSQYRAKRKRDATPEPFDRIHIPATGRLFVVQQHAARHLHFDLRLEIDGVLKSWAVPKGPSDDPADKRFAVETEDHPLDYADFEGEIPPDNYGAGHVIVWDRGTFVLQGKFQDGYAKGKLLFELEGHKLKGSWTMVRLKSRDSTGKEWLLIKETDQYVSKDGLTFTHTSVLSGLTVQSLTDNKPPATLNKLLKRYKSRDTPTPLASKPMLASSGEAHNRRGWLWEFKYDGYRILAVKEKTTIQLITRNGFDISERFPEICQVLSHNPVERFLIDGELVVNNPTGRPSFALMQQRARNRGSLDIARAAIEQPARYFCFDALSVAGQDLCGLPLLQRKEIALALLPDISALVYSEHIEEQGRDVLATATSLGIEGVVGKRAQSRYQHGRSGDWIKVRNDRRGEFVVIGWSTSDKRRSTLDNLSSLALAEYCGDELAYVGHAGSGLGAQTRQELARVLKSLTRKTSPIKGLSSRPGQSKKMTQWVTPRYVVEVKFTEYTPDGHLRHPAIQRIRDDKTPAECIGTFEEVHTNDVPGLLIESNRPEVTVTNPDKVFFPDAAAKPGGVLKQHVVTYYRDIAPWLLPYLADRPIVLTRFPDGVSGKSFYQRDVPSYVPDWLQRESLWSDATEKEIAYFIVRQAEDLAYLANMGTLPIHMWHATLADLDHPDWCVLDLDPKAAPFADVVTLANAIGTLANEADLPALVKTSGASGLHIMLPMGRQLTHSQAQTLGELLANIIVQRYPDIATVARSVRARQNKVYIDYLQNGHGHLIVAPFAVRAEPAASVSMPLRWTEVNNWLNNSKFHIGNAKRRMQRLSEDPFKQVLSDAPDLVRSLSKLKRLTRS